jgi:hypothetical protein
MGCLLWLDVTPLEPRRAPASSRKRTYGETDMSAEATTAETNVLVPATPVAAAAALLSSTESHAGCDNLVADDWLVQLDDAVSDTSSFVVFFFRL